MKLLLTMSDKGRDQNIAGVGLRYDQWRGGTGMSASAVVLCVKALWLDFGPGYAARGPTNHTQ